MMVTAETTTQYSVSCFWGTSIVIPSFGRNFLRGYILDVVVSRNDHAKVIASALLIVLSSMIDAEHQRCQLQASVFCICQEG